MKSFHVIREGIVLEFRAEPEGGYSVNVPALPGCLSYGETFEEANRMIDDAISGWVAVAKGEGFDIPEQFVQLAAAS